MSVSVKIQGIDREVVLKHNRFVFNLKKIPGEYERFRSDLRLYAHGYKDWVETHLVDEVYRPLDPQPDNILNRYTKDIGDIEIAIKLEGIK